jgi:hypothetical protein
MLREILLSATILTRLTNPTSAGEFRPKGARVDFAYDFRPGGNSVKYFPDEDGPEKKTNEIANQEISKAIGSKKKEVHEALSLGTYGSIKIAYTRGTGNINYLTCFHNIPGPDFYIHEPNTNYNKPETVEVFVSLEKDPNTKKWISFRIKSVNDGYRRGTGNWIPYDLSKNLEKRKITKGYSIMVQDAGSKLTLNGSQNGFDMSTAIIKKPCNDLIAKATSQDFL